VGDEVRRAIAPALTLPGLYVGQPAKPTGRLIFQALAGLRLIPAAGHDPPVIPRPRPCKPGFLSCSTWTPPSPPEQPHKEDPTRCNSSNPHSSSCAKDPASAGHLGPGPNPSRQGPTTAVSHPGWPRWRVRPAASRLVEWGAGARWSPAAGFQSVDRSLELCQCRPDLVGFRAIVRFCRHPTGRAQQRLCCHRRDPAAWPPPPPQSVVCGRQFDRRGTRKRSICAIGTFTSTANNSAMLKKSVYALVITFFTAHDRVLSVRAGGRLWA
jgi:hypothetical protein